MTFNQKVNMLIRDMSQIFNIFFAPDRIIGFFNLIQMEEFDNFVKKCSRCIIIAPRFYFRRGWFNTSSDKAERKRWLHLIEYALHPWIIDTSLKIYLRDNILHTIKFIFAQSPISGKIAVPFSLKWMMCAHIYSKCVFTNTMLLLQQLLTRT